MSTRSRIFLFEILLAIIVLRITSANNNLDKSTRYTYGEISIEDTVEDQQQVIKCQSGQIACEAFCIEENKSSGVEGGSLNDTRCVFVGYHVTFVFKTTTTLRPGWFINNANALINKITIRGESIVEIEPGVFDNCVFRSVHSLELRGTSMISIRKGSLAGLHKLKTLALYGNSKMEEIEESALEELYQLEEFIMEEQKEFSDLGNVTEKIEWKYLQTLSLSKNSFGSTIKWSTFTGCTRVQKLNLSNSEIEALGPYSFEPMEQTIEVLDLSSNRLKFLPGALLENLIKPNILLHFSNNLWHCDCASLELQMYEINNSGWIVDSPLICASPEAENANLMRDVTIKCTEPSTESPVDETSYFVPNPPNVDHLTCSDQTDYKFVLTIETEYQYFNIKQECDGKISIEISWPDSTLALVHINDHDYKTRCLYNLKRRMEFDSLNTNAGHLFCLIKKSAYATSPRNCLPFRFTETSFAWGRDRVVITLICSFVLVSLLSLGIGWVLILRYRRAVKSKAKVVLRQGSKDSRTKMISSDDFYSWSIYQQKKKFMEATLRRSNSENSLASHKTYMTPSPIFDVMQRRNRNTIGNSNEYTMTGYTDRLPYDVLPPPPLPPHNDRRERIYETIMDPPFFTCSTGEVVPYAFIHRNY